jgi:hypothetical protein
MSMTGDDRIKLTGRALRGRRALRMLRAKWYRFTHFEFWPWWVFYAPVIGYVLLRLVPKFRSFTVFTAANPAVPAGGLLGESKSAILQGLDDSDGRVATWMIVSDSGDGAERTAALQRWMEAEAVTWPLVLKPDIGERSRDVTVVYSRSEAENYLTHAKGAVLAQVFLGGREYGVFYARRPGQERGRILSITGKRWPSVVGNGRDSIEALILADKRAVLMEDYLLKKFSSRLSEVLPLGETLFLTEIGNHDQGAVFLDLSWASTPELEREIDLLAHRLDGFCLGRFDVRVPTLAALRKGEDFKVLELNGVSAEQSHIYDPNQINIFKSWRVMMTQWHLAFEIGAENVRRGAKKDSFWSVLVKLLRRDRPVSGAAAARPSSGTAKHSQPREESSSTTRSH